MTKKYFETKSLLKRIVKRTNFLQVRDHVVGSACLNRCLLELAVRKLHRFALKIFKILKLCGFKIKFWTIYFYEISTAKNNINGFKKRTEKLKYFLHLWDPWGRFTLLELLFYRIYDQKNSVACFENSEHCTISKHWTTLLGHINTSK